MTPDRLAEIEKVCVEVGSMQDALACLHMATILQELLADAHRAVQLESELTDLTAEVSRLRGLWRVAPGSP